METSIKNRNQSFWSQVEKFDLRKGTIHKLFTKYGPMTDYDLSRLMRLPINSITGRRRELVEIFFVKAISTEQNPHTKKPNTVWDTISPDERTELIEKEVERLKSERFIRLKDLEVIYISDLTRKDILHKVNKISELINKLQA